MITVREPSSAAEVFANAAAVRKRLFSPQRAPVKRAEPADGVVTRIYMTAPAERVWTVQHDWHMRAYIEWQGNPPLGFLKKRCREMGVAYEEILSRSRVRVIVKMRWSLICEIKRQFPSISLNQIGRLFGGMDHTAIRHALINCDINTTWRRITEADENNIHRLMIAGRTQDQIASEIGFSQAAVSAAIRRRGWQNDGSAKRIAPQADQVKTMFDAGASFAEISRQLGFTAGNISIFVRKQGWTR